VPENPEPVLLERELALCARPAELPTARRVLDTAAADFGLDEPGRSQVTTAPASSCSATRDPDPSAEHGWGFPLMNLLVDEVALDTSPDGTVVRLFERDAP
jgi:anti-sigma regulatory factor (Ser/Thr protein kinase)